MKTITLLLNITSDLKWFIITKVYSHRRQQIKYDESKTTKVIQWLWIGHFCLLFNAKALTIIC